MLGLILVLAPGCDMRQHEADSLICRSDNAYLSSRFEQALEYADRSLALDSGVPAAHLHRAFALHALGRWAEGLEAFQLAVALVPEQARQMRPWYLACDCTKRREHVDAVHLDLLERNGLAEEMRALAMDCGDRHAELRALLAVGDFEGARRTRELHADELAPLDGAWELVIAVRAGDPEDARALATERLERAAEPSWVAALFECLEASLGGHVATFRTDYRRVFASLDAAGAYEVARSLGRLGLPHPAFEAWGLAMPRVRAELHRSYLYSARIGQSHAAAVVAGR